MTKMDGFGSENGHTLHHNLCGSELGKAVGRQQLCNVPNAPVDHVDLHRPANQAPITI